LGVTTVQAQVLEPPSLRSSYWNVTLADTSPAITSLSVDGLGKGQFGPPAPVEQSADARSAVAQQNGGWLRYFYPNEEHATWSFRCQGDTLIVESQAQQSTAALPLTLRFRLSEMHATLLGRMAVDGGVKLPAILHLPGLSSIRVTTGSGATTVLGYDAARSGEGFVEVKFPPADPSHPQRTYRLRAVALFPALKGEDATDPRLDGFRRHYMDIFQLHARLHVLANNSASDPCAFTLYEYADMALYLPPLAPGLSAADLIRDSLDRYLDGFAGYGMPSYHMFDSPDASSQPYTFLDVYPSLLISAFDYVEMSHDSAWLNRNYPRLKAWADQMEKTNADGSALLEYPLSGNSGSWPSRVLVRPANWWDTIGYGHQDAYSNALGYRALLNFASLAQRAGHGKDAAQVQARARRLKMEYSRVLINPATGQVAGWRSADGTLHDYDFPFVNGIASLYGLLPPAQARTAMNAIASDFTQAGYSDFHLGIPGNLRPIRRDDYVDLNPRFGGPKQEDGADGFQIYENGGATACFAYFTIAALYHLHDRAQADAILFPMLESFEQRSFSGQGANGMTNDWKDWQGNAHGYEGFLVDSYYTLLAVLDREGRPPTTRRKSHERKIP
jgi:hypothetical protein